MQVVKLLAYISDKDLFAEFYRSVGLAPEPGQSQCDDYVWLSTAGGW